VDKHKLLLTKNFLASRGMMPEKGQGLVEIAIFIFLIALAIFGTIRIFGSELERIFNFIKDLILYG